MLRPAFISALLLASPLAAQEAIVTEVEPAEVLDEMPMPVMIRAEDIEESVVYSLGDAYDQNFWDSGDPFGPVSADWGEIGEVEDLVIDDTGQVLGVTVEVGGFLGIGEKVALIPLQDLRLVQRPEEEGFFIVTRLTNEQLEESEGIEDDLVDADD